MGGGTLPEALPHHCLGVGDSHPISFQGPQCEGYSEGTDKVVFIVLWQCWFCCSKDEFLLRSIGWYSQLYSLSSPRHLLSTFGQESCPVYSVLRGTICPLQASVNWLSCLPNSSGNVVYCLSFNNQGDPVLTYGFHGQTIHVVISILSKQIE